jgi:hypothetical protein
MLTIGISKKVLQNTGPCGRSDRYLGVSDAIGLHIVHLLPKEECASSEGLEETSYGAVHPIWFEHGCSKADMRHEHDSGQDHRPREGLRR